MPAPRTGILMPSIFLFLPEQQDAAGEGESNDRGLAKGAEPGEDFFFFDNSQNDTELMGVKGETDLSSPLCTSAPAQTLQTRTCSSC